MSEKDALIKNLLKELEEKKAFLRKKKILFNSYFIFWFIVEKESYIFALGIEINKLGGLKGELTKYKNSYDEKVKEINTLKDQFSDFENRYSDSLVKTFICFL